MPLQPIVGGGLSEEYLQIYDGFWKNPSRLNPVVDIGV